MRLYLLVGVVCVENDVTNLLAVRRTVLDDGRNEGELLVLQVRRRCALIHLRALQSQRSNIGHVSIIGSEVMS